MIKVPLDANQLTTLLHSNHNHNWYL